MKKNKSCVLQISGETTKKFLTKVNSNGIETSDNIKFALDVGVLDIQIINNIIVTLNDMGLKTKLIEVESKNGTWVRVKN